MENDELIKRLKDVTRHKQNVIDTARLLAERLIEVGEHELAIQLTVLSYSHDLSKYTGIEALFLHRETDDEEMKMAIYQHVTTNPHHPEYWGGINDMPRVYIAELVVDWKSRSTEMGTDIWKWIKEVAVPKYNISTKGKKYKEIKYFLDLLLDPQFKT